MISRFLDWIAGGALGRITEQLRAAYQAKLDAETDEARLAVEHEIERLHSQREIAVIEASDRWSATRMGRLLIVVPFGLWWTAVFIDSIFGFSWDVLDLPSRIWSMAKILVPGIILADATALGAQRFLRR